MAFDFVFTPKKIKKGDLYGFIKSTLEQNGWINLSASRPVDEDVYQSKGESGTENIIVQMKPYYSNEKTTTIINSNKYTMSFRPLSSYSPSPNLNTVGAIVPNSDYQVYTALSSSGCLPDTEITFYFHCNKDRLIGVIEMPLIAGGTSSFFCIGKPHTYADIDEKSTSTTIVSMGYATVRGAICGIKNYNTNISYELTWMNHSIPKSKMINGDAHATELVMTSAIEGIRCKLENIILFNTDITSVENGEMNNDTFVDDKGHIYKFARQQILGSYPQLPTRYFAFRIG